MKKLTFFRALKNIIGCVFCREKDCAVRYNSTRQKATFSYNGELFGQKCKKEKSPQVPNLLQKAHPAFKRCEKLSKELDED